MSAGATASARSCRRMRASGSTPNGKSACSASRSPPPRWATGTSTRPATPAKACRRDLLRCQLLRDLAARVGGLLHMPERFRRRNLRRQGDRARYPHRPQAAGGCGSGGSGQGRSHRTPRPRPPLRHRRPGAHAQSPAEGSHRLPGYARGREGIVTALHGCHVYPDTNAHFEGEQPCPLYTVRFDATELFGWDADPTLTVSIDAWEPYLESA
jgi:hypothetical protein